MTRNLRVASQFRQNNVEILRSYLAQNDIIRWISRTVDQDCLGIILPATAEPEGYSAEKAKGNLKIIPLSDENLRPSVGGPKKFAPA